MSILKTKSNLNFSLMPRMNGRFRSLAIVNLNSSLVGKYYEVTFFPLLIIIGKTLHKHTLHLHRCTFHSKLTLSWIHVETAVSGFPLISIQCRCNALSRKKKIDIEKIVYMKFITFVTHVFPQWRCHKISS